MAVWALNVKMTDPLVVTAGSALSKSPHGKSRELWATSPTRFSKASIFDMVVLTLDVEMAGPLVVNASSARS